jgi:energy-coupling factor transporter ATP-binding protein EcfA2
MIRMKNIRYRYPNTGWILKGIDLSIHRREYIAVFGSNGSGKTTLGYVLNGLIPNFFSGTLEGFLTIDDAGAFPIVGTVMQNADAQLFNSTVENEIAFGLESLGLPENETERRIREISEYLYITNLLGRSPEALSGGEKRMVAIASVLCLKPSILILDEPYSNLDWQGVRQIRGVLKEIHQQGTNVLVIEQRVGGFLRDVTRCLIAEHGKIIFNGTPEDSHGILREKHLIPAYPIPRNRIAACDDPLLAVRNLSYRSGKKEILNNISLEIKNRETVAIIGRNGAGKTTLIKHFNGLLRPSEGELFFRGEKIKGKAPSQLAAEVGLCFQNPNDQFFKDNVKDEILAGARALGKNIDEPLKTICRIFDLNSILDKSPYRLSEGEKKRVALASVLVLQPKLVILDEPTAGQDGRFREILAALLADLTGLGFTIIIVTHDLEFAEATADRWIVLHEGRLVADGSPRDLCHDEGLVRIGAMIRPEEPEASIF